MKSIISFDLDMTLLDHRTWKIPYKALAAIEALRETHIIALATGRDMDHSYSKEFQDIIRPDAIIHMNGTKITVREEVIYEHTMDVELLTRILKYCEQAGYAVGTSVGDDDYYINPEVLTAQDIKNWGQSGRRYQDAWKLLDMPVRTLSFLGDKEKVEDMEAHFPELRVPMFASGTGADVIERQASKAEGLKRLCTHLGVDLSDTIAFGDSMNDYEIVQIAGIGIAMGNAVEELKQVADYVTTPIYEDGIWNACKHYQLIP